MAEIVLFHHAQGLTEGVLSFAEELRSAGHTVHVPDLYDGRTFDTLESGVAHVKELGFATVVERAVAAVEPLTPDLVYAGFSLGVMPAQQLAQTRGVARGALLFSACVDVTEFTPTWPSAVPVQVHACEHDPEFDNGWDKPAAETLVGQSDRGELFLYPGDAHLFADPSLTSYQPEAAALMTTRVLDFLAEV